MDDSQDLRRDPGFIAVCDDLDRDHRRKIAELRHAHGIVGLNELGGQVRPKLGLCDIDRGNMFEDRDPAIGDVVAIGSVYGRGETTVLIGRLASRETDSRRMPVCPDTGYKFAWTVERIADHTFASTRPAQQRQAA